MITLERSLLDELLGVDGKAEIIDGEIVHFPMPGRQPARAAEEVYVSLRQHVKRTGRGDACADGNDYAVDLPRRQSFRPDASYFLGPDPGMKYVDGPPRLAVEVRSQEDYGPAAEREMAAKRADYFASGTLVVWDVDTLGEDVIRVFRDGDGETPAAIYRRGDTADAEPAVPGWSFPVDDLFAT